MEEAWRRHEWVDDLWWNEDSRLATCSTLDRNCLNRSKQVWPYRRILNQEIRWKAFFDATRPVLSAIELFTLPFLALDNMKDEEDQELCFVYPPSQNLFCPICMLLFKNPMITRECGHSFCSHCIQRIDPMNCPLCRTKVFFERFILLKTRRSLWKMSEAISFWSNWWKNSWFFVNFVILVVWNTYLLGIEKSTKKGVYGDRFNAFMLIWDVNSKVPRKKSKFINLVASLRY